MSVDPKTLAVYAAQTARYAGITSSARETEAMQAFLANLPADGHVLDLGCGPGTHAASMQERGITVTAWDASPEFVHMAADKGLDAHVKGFADLSEVEAFDGIWASFSLLHTPKSEHAIHIAAMARALRTGGLLYLGMKVGEGEARDGLGRFYSYVTRPELEGLVKEAGLTPISCLEGETEGLAGTIDPFIVMTSRRDA